MRTSDDIYMVNHPFQSKQISHSGVVFDLVNYLAAIIGIITASVTATATTTFSSFTTLAATSICAASVLTTCFFFVNMINHV